MLLQEQLYTESGKGKIMNEINNIADTTGRATYKTAPTKICPCMEQLYFELEDKEHVF